MLPETAFQHEPLAEPPAESGRRPRVLISAYTCHPEASMESRLAWKRVELAADRHDVTVVCGPTWAASELRREAEERGLAGRVEFHRLGHDRLGVRMIATNWLWYAGYRRWQRGVLRLAKRLHAEQPFDLAHQVNYCGYREPGFLWRLGAPFAWGPVGGTQNFPWRFLRYAGPAGAAREVVRSLINAYQLRFSRRVAKAAAAAKLITVATRQAQRDLASRCRREPPVELETGLDCPIAAERGPRDPNEPLRVLIAGRLQPWKGTPLLLHAIAGLPASVACEVRVLGDGPCLDVWRQLAERLRIVDRVRFVPWPEYRETLEHYRWADVFVFTSLRDTSGTGLIESLAAGAPIIGLDHQGAADIMTDACAIRVPVCSPGQVIADLRDAIATLARDTDRLLRMSQAAQRRAAEFAWDRRQASTNERYAAAMRPAPPVDESAAAGAQPPTAFRTNTASSATEPQALESCHSAT